MYMYTSLRVSVYTDSVPHITVCVCVCVCHQAVECRLWWGELLKLWSSLNSSLPTPNPKLVLLDNFITIKYFLVIGVIYNTCRLAWR